MEVIATILALPFRCKNKRNPERVQFRQRFLKRKFSGEENNKWRKTRARRKLLVQSPFDVLACLYQISTRLDFLLNDAYRLLLFDY